jgi:hypothetical protein
VLLVAFTLAVSSAGCSPADRESQPSTPPTAGETAHLAVVPRADVEASLDRALAGLSALADSIDDVLRPVPLLTPGEEAGLRRYSNADQLARARTLGRRVTSAAILDSLRDAGDLVPLEDSTALWVVRDLEHSQPFATPALRTALGDIAGRFQQRLAALGLPPFRLEVTSALRTPELQAALRGTNPNAAAGVSTHEFGTTVDIAYSAFGAPVATDADSLAAGSAWLEPRLRRIATFVLEAAAARKSRELQAVLGHVLLQAQEDGTVMVTLERQQPVYHITLAREP